MAIYLSIYLPLLSIFYLYIGFFYIFYLFSLSPLYLIYLFSPIFYFDLAICLIISICFFGYETKVYRIVASYIIRLYCLSWPAFKPWTWEFKCVEGSCTELRNKFCFSIEPLLCVIFSPKPGGELCQHWRQVLHVDKVSLHVGSCTARVSFPLLIFLIRSEGWEHGAPLWLQANKLCHPELPHEW